MVAPPDPLLIAAKKAARADAIARRAGRDPSRGLLLARHLLDAMPPPPGAAVSGFWPMGDEIDIRPLLWALHHRGHPILLPETPPKGQPLIFRRWTPGCRMIAERFGTFRPDGPVGRPDIVLAPLLAFDRAGRRLGYGGGFYDRTLPTLPDATAIGCAYATQEMPEVPAGPSDVRLSAIATDLGVIRAEPA